MARDKVEPDEQETVPEAAGIGASDMEPMDMEPGVLPHEQHIALGTAEAAAATETVVPEVEGAPTGAVPEDVLGERDLEARLGREDVRQRLSEGRPPAEEEPRS